MREVKKQLTVFLFSLLIILSGAVAAYSQCIQAGHYLDFAEEEEASSIHCPEVVLNSTSQVSSLSRSYGVDYGKVLPSAGSKANTARSLAYFRERAALKGISQQNLYQIEEVYRL